MSEYWVSHKRYHCKYCNIYIADDKPSRQQHENGLRHKGNVERFVRGLYKEGEKRVREREEEKGVMASVGKAAEAAYALDVASGRATPSSASSSIASSSRAPQLPPAPKPKPVKSSDPYANYTTAASLGYTDPDAEEAQRRRAMGVPGEWTVVAPTPPSEGSTGVTAEDGVELEESHVDRENNKRPAPTTDVGEEDPRAFKFRKKTAGLGLGEIYDPGIIPIKIKTKEEEDVKEEQKRDDERGAVATGATGDGTSEGGELGSKTPVLKWTKVQWKKVDTPPQTYVIGTATEVKPDTHAATNVCFPTMSAESGLTPPVDHEPPKDVVKAEPDVSLGATVPEGVKKEGTPLLTEPTQQPASGLFRKRKLPIGGRGT
ncbi:hypothetical protein BU15DRAFT_87125 [Melanogaster broomeanus]|nr:hypothetical protein BU15DRAFT_87125 [Melanogaster broomeanus]